MLILEYFGLEAAVARRLIEESKGLSAHKTGDNSYR